MGPKRIDGMSETPSELRFTKDHQWVREQDDGSLLVGITDQAQTALGDLVFIELPDEGALLAAGDACAVVESVKAASDVCSPLTGTVSAINRTLEDSPELVNNDPYGDGWLFALNADSPAELEELLTADDYERLIAEMDD
jgi:glycine cleavage system H protein